MRYARLLAPTAGTGLLRVAQLASLLAITRLTEGDLQSFLVTGFGVLASFSVISDSGAANYLLSLSRERQNRRTYALVLGLQACIAAVVLVAVFVFLILISPDGLNTGHFAILIALALSQTLDGVGRAAKAPLLVNRRDDLFAAPDIATGIAKLAVVAIALLASNLDVLMFMPLVSAAALAIVIVLVRRGLGTEAQPEPKLFRKVLEIGVTGSLSALYSQSPMFLAAALLPLNVAAELAVIFRVVQALELVPATLSVQMIPRIKADKSPLRLWLMFLSAGLAIALVVIFCWPLVSHLLDIALRPEFYIPVTIAFAFKCGNYAIVAYLLGSGRVRARLIVTVTTGVIALLLVTGCALAWGGFGLAIATAAIELVFLGVAILVLGRTRRTPERLVS